MAISETVDAAFLIFRAVHCLNVAILRRLFSWCLRWAHALLIPLEAVSYQRWMSSISFFPGLSLALSKYIVFNWRKWFKLITFTGKSSAFGGTWVDSKPLLCESTDRMRHPPPLFSLGSGAVTILIMTKLSVGIYCGVNFAIYFVASTFIKCWCCKAPEARAHPFYAW